MLRAVFFSLLLMAVSGCGEKATEGPKPQKSTTDTAAGSDTSTGAEASASTAEAAPAPIDPQRAFRPCAVCHSVADPSTPKGRIQLAGPNLFGIYKAKAAQQENFAYSNALREADIVWNEEALDALSLIHI